MSRATVTARAGRAPARPPRSPADRRQRARSALAAAGVILPTYDLLYGSQIGLVFEQAVMNAGFTEADAGWWPTEESRLQAEHAIYRDGDRGAVYRLPDGTLVSAQLDGDSIRISISGPSRAAVLAARATFSGLYPASFVNNEGDSRVPITFWALGQYGPQPRLRRIEATSWDPIAGNYTATVRDELAALMAWTEPSVEGQLLLWQGPPGTGKTWALRALASEWAPWAEFNYITDPDSFFVDAPSYMVDVLLSESYMAVDEPTGDVYEEQAEGKWRVLILEDTGELLSANAKEKYGQGLSRLLNVVDGMIGQGLRVLVLVTTNDELGELNPAVLRAGRCASQIVFAPLTPEEASSWAGETVAEGGTVAELYARYGASSEPRDAFEDEEALVADALEDDPALQEVLRLAREPLELDPEPEPTPAPEPVSDAVREALAAAGASDGPRRDRLTSVLEAISAAHGRTMDAVAQAITAAAVAPEESRHGDALALTALGVLSEFACRPEAAPSPIHVHVPEQNLSVSVAAPEILLPQQPAPHVDVHVAAAEAPQVLVSLPEQPRPDPTPVHVHVAAPEPIVIPAPTINLSVAAPEPAAQPLRGIRVEFDEDGSKIFVPVEIEETA